MASRTLDALVGVVAESTPELAGLPAQQLPGGEQHDVIRLGDWVVRFPRSADPLALGREVALLRALAGRLPVPLPAPRLVDHPHHPHTLHRFLPGVPLTPDRILAGGSGLERVADQLGGFLRALHLVDPAPLGVDLPTTDGSERWRALRDSGRREVFGRLSDPARRRLEDHFERGLDALDRSPFAPALRHGDFGPTNLLFDPKRERVCGVLDFGRTALGDPAYDLASLGAYGPRFQAVLFDRYPSFAPLATRAHFYRGTFALQEALFGLRSGDPRALEAGLAALDRSV